MVKVVLHEKLVITKCTELSILRRLKTYTINGIMASHKGHVTGIGSEIEMVAIESGEMRKRNRKIEDRKPGAREMRGAGTWIQCAPAQWLGSAPRMSSESESELRAVPL